ncbi:hypothetical protein ACRRTK_011045 [Alexandromys fortis]
MLRSSSLPFKPAGLEKTPADPLQVAWRSRCERVTDFQPDSCGKRLGRSQPGALSFPSRKTGR